MCWPFLYPFPQRPAGLEDEAFGELAKRWHPILDKFDDCGVDNDCGSIDEDGTQGNGLYDFGETFIDENGNGIWDEYGLTDSLNNMIQLEFESDFDSIGLSIVEDQLGLNFF